MQSSIVNEVEVIQGPERLEIVHAQVAKEPQEVMGWTDLILRNCSMRQDRSKWCQQSLKLSPASQLKGWFERVRRGLHWPWDAVGV
jgi:hypothetical protein